MKKNKEDINFFFCLFHIKIMVFSSILEILTTEQIVWEIYWLCIEKPAPEGGSKFNAHCMEASLTSEQHEVSSPPQ